MATPHLRQENGPREDEKVAGVDQGKALTCCGKLKVCAGMQSLKMTIQGKEKLVILTNCPDLSKSERENYATLAKTGVHHYSSNIIDLVPAGGNFYRVFTLAIIDSDGSDITRRMPEQTG